MKLICVSSEALTRIDCITWTSLSMTCTTRWLSTAPFQWCWLTS